MRIGVIADTHGLVHARVADVFARVDHIVHAGDIGGDHVLAVLRDLAPLTSVEGNNDDATGEEIVRVKPGGLRILLTHILPRPRKPAARVIESLRKQPADFVIFGHSHLPHHERLDGVVYFNPASAGPRRFDLPVAVGIIEKKGKTWHAYHIALDERSVEALKKRMNQLSRGS
jgi:putative phosphoesterase